MLLKSYVCKEAGVRWQGRQGGVSKNRVSTASAVELGRQSIDNGEQRGNKREQREQKKTEQRGERTEEDRAESRENTRRQSREQRAT
jgi:hypothetical protein